MVRVPALPTVSPLTYKPLRARRRDTVGPGQPAVMVQVVAWIDAQGGRLAVAKRLRRTEGLISKYLTCAVVFSESTAAAWAGKLKLTVNQRAALINLAAIATMTERQLAMLGAWEARIRRLGKALGTAERFKFA